jgi:DNA-binding FadR family transcriptional regulator
MSGRSTAEAAAGINTSPPMSSSPWVTGTLETVDAHRVDPTEAIRKQDPEAAGRRMKRHVHAYAESVAELELHPGAVVSEH